LSFVFFYVATFILLAWARFPPVQVGVYWGNLICASVATALTVVIWERGRWPLGLFVTPRLALPEFLRGLWWGFLLISGCAVLIVLSTGIRHHPGTGFPWLELIAIFLPAVVHEELLFRGYPFQKLLRWNRPFALFGMSLIFAGLHAGNSSVTTLGLLNIFLGGLLLSLAYVRYGRLWFPIGLHLAWNLTTGPILGHEVSGYELMRSILIEQGGGPDLLTGGDFGIEGSVWMTLTELVAIALMIHAAPNMIRPARVEHAGMKE
jgi:membrane protease YdiL (CAAX protease family)